MALFCGHVDTYPRKKATALFALLFSTHNCPPMGVQEQKAKGSIDRQTHTCVCFFSSVCEDTPTHSPFVFTFYMLSSQVVVWFTSSPAATQIRRRGYVCVASCFCPSGSMCVWKCVCVCKSHRHTDTHHTRRQKCTKSYSTVLSI